MSQLSLVRSATPVVSDLVDLRCCDIAELLDDLREEPALVVADPPWSYSHPAQSNPGHHYQQLLTPDLAAHVDRAPGSRLALWITWPLMAEWRHVTAGWSWGDVVTGGAWLKSGDGDSGHYGQGYHWSGCSEPVLVYTRKGAHTDRSQPLRNAWHEPPGAHSAKPIDWQAQWVRRWVPPGGLVLDLYAGLGSVARSVLRAGEGRRYVGAEVDPERHAAALSLIAQERA